MAGPVTPSGLGVRIGSLLVSFATAFVLLGASIVPFLTPTWIHFEQDRAGSAALTGLAPATMYRYTDGIVHDLVFGGDFRVTTDELVPYLSEPDVAHMRDVRGVFGGFGLLALIGIGVLAGAFRRSTTDTAVARCWRAVQRGASTLGVLMAVLGILAIGAFDTVFEVFHRLFFAPGTYTFDPATDHLVQLFPDAFWSETALAFGAFVVVLSLVVGWFARRQAATPAAHAAVTGAEPSAAPGSAAS